VIIVMAVKRVINCVLCQPAKELHIPAPWTADQALDWYYDVHLKTHTDDLGKSLEALLMLHTPECRRCRGQKALRNLEHRPCYETECYCRCSRPTTTTTERTARAE
jgi:hypothetical protein